MPENFWAGNTAGGKERRDEVTEAAAIAPPSLIVARKDGALFAFYRVDKPVVSAEVDAPVDHRG